MTKKISWFPLVALVLSLAGATTSTFAADKKEGPCRQDAEKLCPGLKWGKGLGKGLKEHKAEISPACQAKIEERKEKREERREEKNEAKGEAKD